MSRYLTAEVRVGDCRELLAAMPAESVQTCITSPPYWGLRDYGVEGQLGLESTPTEYVERMVEVFREVRRVLRPDGTLWLNLGDTYCASAGQALRGGPPSASSTLEGTGHQGGGPKLRALNKRGARTDRLANGRGDNPAVLRRKTRATRDGTHAGKNTAMAALGPMAQPNRAPLVGLKPKDLIGIPWRVALALQADGWFLRCDIIWHKPCAMPEAVKDRPTKAHEYVFLLSKSERYFYDAAAVAEPTTGNAHRRGAGVNPKASAYHAYAELARRRMHVTPMLPLGVVA